MLSNIDCTINYHLNSINCYFRYLQSEFLFVLDENFEIQPAINNALSVAKSRKLFHRRRCR